MQLLIPPSPLGLSLSSSPSKTLATIAGASWTTPRPGPPLDGARRPGRVRPLDSARRPSRVRTSTVHDAPAGSATGRRTMPQLDLHLDDARHPGDSASLLTTLGPRSASSSTLLFRHQDLDLLPRRRRFLDPATTSTKYGNN
jgi:hypothetical protein